jgi:hypothetical protein
MVLVFLATLAHGTYGASTSCGACRTHGTFRARLTTVWFRSASAVRDTVEFALHIGLRVLNGSLDNISAVIVIATGLMFWLRFRNGARLNWRVTVVHSLVDLNGSR